MRKKKNSQQLTPDQNWLWVFWVLRENVFLLSDTKILWSPCVWLCWKQALLVAHITHPRSGFPGELCSPAFWTHKEHLHLTHHAHLSSHHGRLPASCSGRWNRTITWFGLIPALRPSFLTQIFFYSTDWLCLGWAQDLFGYSLVIIHCHGASLKIQETKIFLSMIQI